MFSLVTHTLTHISCSRSLYAWTESLQTIYKSVQKKTLISDIVKPRIIVSRQIILNMDTTGKVSNFINDSGLEHFNFGIGETKVDLMYRFYGIRKTRRKLQYMLTIF